MCKRTKAEAGQSLPLKTKTCLIFKKFQTSVGIAFARYEIILGKKKKERLFYEVII